MFNNIIKKLKISATVIFFLGIIFSCICLIGIAESASFLLIAIMIFFPMWFTSILVYAFAELLQHTKEIKENTSKLTIIQRKLTNEQVSDQEEL